ncbi:glyoxylase-like metal-dependent hydrolase (beta-lactamase superfamily II) [Propionicimonas paludicola]|uniref:Glyoxylase-like metal-dependent hydrolase (Beta-lactamase superfamily II) n=1 Tax=Propionicimonas paludicola TaxID=185243 RepID=A0A2A9CSW8_9ACTN|nr:MBL fold metallo-hydrolase [Propionicimonas paludicola]PFG17537.1 glyoxylase-like metal-dependent hydrolase (beta-lactamase superfamily II) [Propionicimonas paludicola]
MKLAEGLHRIGNDLVACHLVVTPDGLTLVDAGLAGHWKPLLRELGSIGADPEDISAILLTHGDSDHVGFAERLRREHGVPAYIHAADAGRATGGPKPETGWGKASPFAVVQFLGYAATHGGLKTEWLTEVTSFEAPITLDVPGRPQVIGLPGHSPGSVAFHFASVGALFVGDALTTRDVLTGRRGLAPAPFTDEPAQAVTSLHALAELPTGWLVPGHGPALPDITPVSLEDEITRTAHNH